MKKNIEKTKKKMLLQMEKEIKQLENELKYSKQAKIKKQTIKNLKIFSKFIHLVAPYAVTAGIVAGGFKLCGMGYPFLRDTYLDTLDIKKQFDSLGNTKCEQQYEDYKTSENVLRYVTKWKKESDGSYIRNIEIYSIGNISEEKVQQLFVKEDVTLEELFGEPLYIKKEKRNNITLEELNEPSYFQATLYSTDENKYIVYQESQIDNISCSFFYIMVNLILSVLISSLRKGYSTFNYFDEINKIKTSTSDYKTIQKKLEIKKNNYERLTR